jgi:hypothetical protein
MDKRISISVFFALAARFASAEAPPHDVAAPSEYTSPANTPGAPIYRLLYPADTAQVEQGRSIFETQWAAASALTEQRVGIGPL